MAIKVSLGGLGKELEKLAKEAPKRIREGVILGVAKSIPDLVRDSPIDTGLYAASWDFTVEEKSVILGNYAPYAGIIEVGARPFTPPIGPLLAWAKRVLGDPSQPPDYSPEVWGLARGTQAKISREGMQPRNILERNLPKIIKNIKEEVLRAGKG